MKIKYNYDLIKALQTYHNVQTRFDYTRGQRVMITDKEWENIKYLMFPYSKEMDK